MNLHCISYHNIGPFAEKTISVNFQAGAHLIKAPIGSGKSFLFFDGPLYALYKHQSRQMLSRTAEKGWMHCIFSHNDTVWYIERNISATKSGNDSTKSRFYSLGLTPQQVDEQLMNIGSIAHNVDLCKDFLTTAEEISFTNQRELEASLQELLPPKEVIMSVYVMVQDAQHVFELTPSERINVFKHLFGLLGIDEAKDTIHSRRREVQGMLAVLDDQSAENTKVQKSLQSIQQTIQSIELHGLNSSPIRSSLQGLALIKDSSILGESLTIEGLTITENELVVLSDAQKSLQEKIISGATLSASLTATKQTIADKKITYDSGREELLSLEKTLIALKNELGTEITQEFEKCLTQKKVLQQESDTINSFRDKTLFPERVSTLFDAENQINERISQGKQLAKDIEMAEFKLGQSKKQQDEYLTRKKALEEQKLSLDAQYDEQMKFHCDKIEGDCPYVEMIKGAAGRSLQKQRTLVEKQLVELERNKPLQNTPLEKNKHDLEHQKKEIGKKLQAANWKEILEKRKDLELIQQKLTIVEKQLTVLEQQQQQQVKKREQLQEATIKKDLLSKTNASLQKEMAIAQNTLQSLEKERSDGGFASIEKFQSYIQEIAITYTQLHTVIQDYSSKKQQKFALEEEFKRLKNLHQIFSKELLVVVLQDFLPQLEEVINAYLSQVVEYEVRFLTPTSVDDSLELDITVHDDHGERGVKSLSGGQRAILKICWILAVASLMKSRFLFLDETITSLDSSAVGRVGELIKQFVQKNNMKLYVVTHAQQIQEMDLWDEVVTLNQQ